MIRWIQNPLPVWSLRTGQNASNAPYNLRRYITNNLEGGDLQFAASLAESDQVEIIKHLRFMSGGKSNFPDTLAVGADLPLQTRSGMLPINVYDIGFGEKPFDSTATTILPIHVHDPLQILASPPIYLRSDDDDIAIAVTATGGIGGYRWDLLFAPDGVHIADVHEKACIVAAPRSVFNDANTTRFVITVGVSTGADGGYDYLGEEETRRFDVVRSAVALRPPTPTNGAPRPQTARPLLT